MIGPATFPLSLMFRSGTRPRTTSPVVVRKARTPRTSRAPFTNKGKKASTRTTFLLRADVAKCLTLLVIVSCCCGRCSFARAREPTQQTRKECLSGHLRMIRAVWRETLTYSFFLGGGGPTGSPHWLGPGLSESEVVGLPIPTRGMLGFAKSSTLRCSWPIGSWRTSRYQRRSLWSLLYPYWGDATKCSDHCAMS